MNEMRKLMEALDKIEEVDVRLGPQDYRTETHVIHVYDDSIEVYGEDDDGISFTKEEWQNFVDLIAGQGLPEAHQGGKTEHSGAKHGKGAYYGRKKEAKRDSNKNRRRADKSAVNEEPGDNGPLGYDDTPGVRKYTYGPVTVDFDEEGGEVLMTHGHGQNIFLNMQEWMAFYAEIQDIL